VIAFLLILAGAISAVLVGLALRLPSLVSTVLASYLAWVVNLGLVTLVLSPFRQVDRGGLAVAEAIILAGAFVAWWSRGRFVPSFAPARTALAEAASSPWTLLFLIAVVALLGYELALGLTMPPNNWDAYTYHLARVAAWVHHGGVYWIPNAPTDRLNEFQPLAEQQILFLFVARGGDQFYAVPQFLAELAILLSVYGCSRRLGYGVRPSASAAFLLATFSLFVLESSTAQNDLVAASFPVIAACFLLSGGPVEAALAGAAASLGLGAKLTTVVVWPVLAWLAIVRGRRTVWLSLAGVGVGLLTIGCWSYVLNLAHTGQVLGHGGGRVEYTGSPSYPGSFVTLFSTLYMLMDLSKLWPLPIVLLTVAGLLVAAVVGARAWRRRADAPNAALEATSVALPFLACALVIVGGAVFAFLTRRLGASVKGPGGSYSSESGLFGGLNNTADEDSSEFGPIGAIVLLAVPVVTVFAYFARRVDSRQLALACALPLFLVVLALGSTFNVWLGRFLIVPVALTAPLFARLFRGSAATAAYLAVGVLVAVLVAVGDRTKVLTSPLGAPWNLTRVEAVTAAQRPAARGYAALERALPAGGCVGAVLSSEDPSYLLGGPGFSRRVIYLPADDPVSAAQRSGLRYVVITRTEMRTDAQRRAVERFTSRGWKISDLGGFWWLASAGSPAKTDCR
jgi:hypothetical protein